MSLIVLLAAAFTASFAALTLLAALAPVGYQDEHGFHYGRLSALAVPVSRPDLRYRLYASTAPRWAA